MLYDDKIYLMQVPVKATHTCYTLQMVSQQITINFTKYLPTTNNGPELTQQFAINYHQRKHYVKVEDRERESVEGTGNLTLQAYKRTKNK